MPDNPENTDPPGNTDPPERSPEVIAPEVRDPEADPVEASEDVVALRGEAKKRRLALREVEAERDGLRERVDKHDRAHVERQAEHFAKPSDVWLATSIDKMRGDDGALDDDLVAAELGRVSSERPHWLRPFPDVHQGVRESVEPAKPSFGQASSIRLAAEGADSHEPRAQPLEFVVELVRQAAPVPTASAPRRRPRPPRFGRRDPVPRRKGITLCPARE